MGDDVLADLRRFAEAVRDRRIPYGPPPTLVPSWAYEAARNSHDPAVRLMLRDGRIVKAEG